MKNIMIFENNELGINVRAIKNEDGSISINAEDTAIGFGWYQVKNNRKYPKWERMNGFISEFESSPQVEKGDYIPESLFYLLAMKANNDVARKFQVWLAGEVIPTIRKTGGYISTTNDMSDEDILARALQIANAKIEERNKQIKELKPKAEYTDMVLQSNNLFTISQIASDYGMSAQELNLLLKKFEIQYKQSGQWLLYKPYKDKGYACSETTIISKGLGRVRTSMHTKWTQKGRKFIYDFLKCKGIVPTMEW